MALYDLTPFPVISASLLTAWAMCDLGPRCLHSAQPRQGDARVQTSSTSGLVLDTQPPTVSTSLLRERKSESVASNQ